MKSFPILVSYVSVFIFVRILPSDAWIRNHREFSINVSHTLDSLLNKTKYDLRIRPNFGGSPVNVTVLMNIRSMSAISETNEYYSMDCYFRQMWYDNRLKYTLPGIREISLPYLFLDKIWKPDTFFMNGKKSYLHRITVPNKFIRIREDGFLTYSQRLTIQASCPMHLRKFPLDSQKCPLLISSYGYRTHDIMYRWMDESNSENSVEVDPTLEIAQYHLTQVTIEGHKVIPRGNSGKDRYSMIQAVFHLKRLNGFYMLQVYVPCALIVCCSWVSFWIDPDAVPARISLGIMNALSMMTMGFGGKSQMPHVSYATALDWFIILCFSFVFAVMIEFAFINFKDKITTDLKRILQDKIGKRRSTSKDARKLPTEVTLNVPTERPRSLSMVEFPSIVVIPDAAEPVTTNMNNDTEIYIDDISKASGRSGHIYGRIQKKNSETSSSEKEHEVQVISPIIRIIRRLSQVVLPNPEELPPPVSPRQLPSIMVSRGFSESNLASLSLDDSAENIQESMYEDIHVTNVLDVGEENNYSVADDHSSSANLKNTLKETLNSVAHSICNCFKKPVKFWNEIKFLPKEEDVSKQMMCKEPKEKFTIIDIYARIIFPLSFFILLTIYWVLYLHYITDEFPSTKKSF